MALLPPPHLSSLNTATISGGPAAIFDHEVTRPNGIRDVSPIFTGVLKQYHLSPEFTLCGQTSLCLSHCNLGFPLLAAERIPHNGRYTDKNVGPCAWESGARNRSLSQPISFSISFSQEYLESKDTSPFLQQWDLGLPHCSVMSPQSCS